jgi:Na+/proline symporter/nitrogen-specific signal transduction histidine kinase
MSIFNILLLVALIYAAFLFAIAFWAERRAARGRLGWLRSPLVYTLSLSVYCTAWTFFGAVGSAARSGLEYLSIYLGPTLVFVGWYWLLRKLVRIGRAQRITSIADLISSRFGKSNGLGVLVTVLAVAGTTPYIALQLQSVAQAFTVFSTGGEAGMQELRTTALVIALGLIAFTILFGTRNLDTNERHHGVVMAIALEAVVKLLALLAVGGFVVWGLADGPSDMLARIDASGLAQHPLQPGRWASLTFLSAAAIICLPRMFQVLVVENWDEGHLNTAAWAFPAYLMLISLFVIPIAVMGLELLPNGGNPDLFVLTLPLSQGQTGLAFLTFLGGFSSATSMVIVAAIALSTMLSNHILMPAWLALSRQGATVSGDVRHVVLISRRFSIAGVLLLGYAYFRYSSGGAALAAIGVVSFAGVAQVLPAALGAIFWRGATRVGAGMGLSAGFALWLYTLFLPSLAAQADWVQFGPWGLDWLRPQALLGLAGLDPLVHALIWSLLINTALFVVGSLLTFPTPMERLQGAQFVNAFDRSPQAQGWSGAQADSEDLLVMAQRILGAKEAQALFQSAAAVQGKAGYLPDPTHDFIERLERELTGSVGAATAHAMVAQISGGAAVSVQDLLAVADESAQLREYSQQLQAKSAELQRTAVQLRDANTQLTQLSQQKDAFLSQISHELRTPMTSIQSFSQILRDTPDLQPSQMQHFSSIIHDESQRLTRLLDDLLDLSVLENGRVVLNLAPVNLADLLDRAQSAALVVDAPLQVSRAAQAEAITLITDADRLAQVFINLISNAKKYCDNPVPHLRIDVRQIGDQVELDFIDNGSGIPGVSQSIIFEKFSRLSDISAAGSAGLGLAICRQVMEKLGGSIDYLPGQGGAAFRVRLPINPNT